MVTMQQKSLVFTLPNAKGEMLTYVVALSGRMCSYTRQFFNESNYLGYYNHGTAKARQ